MDAFVRPWDASVDGLVGRDAAFLHLAQGGLAGAKSRASDRLGNPPAPATTRDRESGSWATQQARQMRWDLEARMPRNNLDTLGLEDLITPHIWGHGHG